MDAWRFDPSLPGVSKDKTLKNAKTKAEIIRTVVAVGNFIVALTTLIVVLSK